MRVNRSLLGWGVFLILLGAVPIAVRQGVVGAETVAGAWQLWPLILVGIGIGLVLRGTSAELLGGLVVAVTFGLIGGSVIATGLQLPGFAGCAIGDGDGTPFEARDGALTDGARVIVDLDCGELSVDASSGDGWALTGTDRDGEGPQVDARLDRLRIASREDEGWSFGDADRWELTLPAGPSLRLDLNLNAGSGEVDLADARVPDLAANVNAGSLDLDLGGAAEVDRLDATVNAGSLAVTLPPLSLNGTLSANAGSIELCIPDGVGVRIRTDDNLTAAYDFENAGLVQSGSTWQSPDYASAQTTIDLSATANAGNVTLNPEDGCGE